MSEATTEQRVARLSAAAARRVVEPDDEVRGRPGDGQVLPDDLLSIAGLDLDLAAEQRHTLAREEVASITQAGVRFEAVLEAGFAAQIATAPDLTDPRLTFVFHELGEETRHQRLFQRLLTQLEPTARPPLPFRVVQHAYRLVMYLAIRYRAFLYALVLAGEEIPDLLQKVASEHPDTDAFVRALNGYHRMEEARHLAFARLVYSELWSDATRTDRFLVRQAAPRVIRIMFDSIVHPGVYRVVGLPALRTWRDANRTPARVQLRREATRPVLAALVNAGAIPAGRVPRSWQRLCGVDRRGDARPDVSEPWAGRQWSAAAD
jgi:hypothetical protein